MAKASTERTFNNLNTALSFFSAIIAVIEVSLRLAWYVYVITFAVILVVWISALCILLYRRPWHKSMRNPLITFRSASGYPFRTAARAVFRKPYYESEFISPRFNNVMDAVSAGKIDTSRLTVVVEDDPVGYADNSGMLPCIPVDEEMTSAQLYEKLVEMHDEIIRYNFLFIATPSRRIDSERAFVLNREIGTAFRKYHHKYAPERKVRLISKIDSCLRSNYEAEYEGLTDGLGKRECMELLVPSYIEQGRVSLHGCQYIKTHGRYVLMHESEYASFKGLEYGNSDLALWLEKRVPHIGSRKNVGLVDVDVLRTKTSAEIVDTMEQAASRGVKAFVCDSSDLDDLRLIVGIVNELESRSRTVFLKFGPSMINCIASAYAVPHEPNRLSQIHPDDKGIFIAGSLTSTTKKQIERYDDYADTSIVTIKESDLTNVQGLDSVIVYRSNNIIRKNENGDDVVLTTEYWKTDKNEYPDIEKRDMVLNIIARICQVIRTSESRWFLFKGSDTALYSIIHGLDIRHFYYCGQYIPGVIHCKCMVNGALKSFFIVGGNVGTEKLLMDLRTAIKKELAETPAPPGGA